MSCCKECEEKEKFYSSLEEKIPYKEFIEDNKLIRLFSKETDEHLLKWHWDEEDRLITPLGDNDWKFQFDDELPINIDKEIFISKGIYHRIIKGTTDLKICIKKF